MESAQLPLKDIHLPDPIGWWPMAPGWWILMFLSISLSICAVWWWSRFKRYAARRETLRAFKALKTNCNLTSQQRIELLSALLRRACISIFPRQQTASLCGRDWLDFLDGQLKDGRFSEGVGTILLEAPYRKNVNDDLQALFELCEEWVKSLPASVR